MLAPFKPNSISFVEVDVDGCLVDSIPLACRLYRQAAQEVAGVNLEASMVEALFLGGNDSSIRKLLCETVGDDFPAEAVRSRHRQLTDEETARNPEALMPGVQELFTLLRRREIPVAANSGNTLERTEQRLERVGIRQFVHVVVGGDEVVQGKGKPEPDTFQLAMKKLIAAKLISDDTSPSNGLMLGDTELDMVGANRAGLHTLYVPGFTKVHRTAMLHATKTRSTISNAIPLLRTWLRKGDRS